jgi:poly(A) polymerase
VARADLYAHGAATYRGRILMGWARSGQAPEDPAWRERYGLAQRWQPPRFPLGGADVVAAGVPPGPRVGELLRAIEACWIAGDFMADELALRAKLAQLTRGI